MFVRLGTGFLRRWHATFHDGEHAVAYVAVASRDHAAADAGRTSDGDVVGFLLGATDQVAHMEDVIAAHRRELMLAGAGALLVRPALAAHFLRTRARRYLRRLLRRRPARAVGSAGGAAGAPRVAVVTAVAVIPGARGQRIGAGLLEAFVGDVRRAGTPAIELVTRADEEGASAFYTHLRWTAQDVHADHGGGQVRRFRRELATDASPHAERREPG
jgi:ribosomal protein S18 acetylase RimI-like enzyme